MSRTILGLSAYYHDSAAALVRGGEVVAAAQEERFSRKKHDAAFPAKAVAYCLQEADLAAGDLDHVVFYEKPLLKFDRLLESYVAMAPRGIRSFLQAMPAWLKTKLHLPREIRKALGGAFQKRVVFTRHHEAHAASAFFPSPFEEAAILTLDGVGEWDTASIGHGRGNRIELRKTLGFPHSLGLLYSAFTYFCGFRVNSGEYKLMGLAPYGRPRFAAVIRERLLDLKEDGSFRLDLRYFDFVAGWRMTNARFAALFEGPPRTPEGEITQREMDLAASIQVVTEEIVLRMAQTARAVTGARNLVMAGGVALNCVANGRLLEAGIFDALWFPPAAGDAGGALGAALFVAHQILGEERWAMRDGGLPMRDERWAMRDRGLAMRDEGLAMSDEGLEVGGRTSAAGAGTELSGERALGAGDPSDPLAQVAPESLADGGGAGKPDALPLTPEESALVASSLTAHPSSQRRDALRGSFLGPAFSEEEVRAFLVGRGARFQSFEEEGALLATVAEALERGLVVGWFHGRMEFGPRALGARSILGDPRDPAMQAQMNLRIKFRESFRPFAPSCLAEKAAEWFQLGCESPYMLLVAGVRPEHRRELSADERRVLAEERDLRRRVNVVRSRVPAVTHVDYSARVQTVTEAGNGRFYRLIREFARRTGCPMLVNTSFNVRGEPIVCSPEDAWRCFMATDMDALVLENCVLWKAEQPALSPEERARYLGGLSRD